MQSFLYASSPMQYVEPLQCRVNSSIENVVMLENAVAAIVARPISGSQGGDGGKMMITARYYRCNL